MVSAQQQQQQKKLPLLILRKTPVVTTIIKKELPSASAGSSSGVVMDAKNLISTMTDEQKNFCDSHIQRMEKDGFESKSRYMCMICNKSFLGSRNAQDHMTGVHMRLKVSFYINLSDFYKL